jgi:hypothetical protein
MAILTVQIPGLTGTVTVKSAATGGGDSFPNTGQEILHVENLDAAPHTVTADAPNTCSFGATAAPIHDGVIVVAAGATQEIGPFPVARFNDVNNRVQLTYDAVTAVKVWVTRTV